jgi:hypothetical protein
LQLTDTGGANKRISFIGGLSTGLVNNGWMSIDSSTWANVGISGSLKVTNELYVTGSVNASSITGSLLGTASYATTALSASYAGNVPVTASYALSALSSSYAVTASFALNAGGGSGVGFPFTGSAQVTGSMGVTGSLAVSGSLRIGTAFNQTALLVTGSTFISGSSIGFSGQLDDNTNLTADKNGIINLAGLGGVGFTGKFVLPNDRPDQAVAGSIYWDDAAGVLYVFKESDPAGWTAI